jgi:hypothetical protein
MMQEKRRRFANKQEILRRSNQQSQEISATTMANINEEDENQNRNKLCN